MESGNYFNRKLHSSGVTDIWPRYLLSIIQLTVSGKFTFSIANSIMIK